MAGIARRRKIWQLRLQAKGAIALMLYYETFYLPEGGKLFIYNAEKTHLLEPILRKPIRTENHLLRNLWPAMISFSNTNRLFRTKKPV